ncbi:MAG: 4-(cytidine 5'-diphospho)-2-C-methyl-D-erythritol kinase [Peptococcaceae bacterium]|jgi:4-diphosphocytidyl-2-C-methyl-D-erythritol kinase|nr:4-(cytidine 5'-diphospho)-2-C-methyl-D-erythritol kinase [Peptococcaceae bacterium]MDH7526090.1 4-(cytidine 5'-diphospho)-2-C-methyl-D-erythritol kinase [Peptococcaceae bacterium]
MINRIAVKAYAKVNLALDVLGKRDDGYHEVQMVMQGIDLYDLVELEKSGRCIRLTCNWAELGTGKDNLAYRAASLLSENYPVVKGVKINLRKKIPLAAGLGGGSADAAAVLLGLNELFALGLSIDELKRFAAVLGSDVPFCLRPLTAYAWGRGEQIVQLPPCPRLWVVLAKPPFGVSTGEVYRRLHSVTVRKRPAVQQLIAALSEKKTALMFEHMENVLEYAAFDMHPQLREHLQQMQEMGAAKAMMSGSGPTLLAFYESEEKARQAASLLAKPGWKLFVARTLGPEDMEERGVYL